MGKSLGGSASDYSPSVLQIPDGGYIVAGSSGSDDGDVNINYGGDDYWVVKLVPLMTSTNQMFDSSTIDIVPNPSQGVFTLSINQAIGPFEIQVHNLLGELFYHDKNYHSYVFIEGLSSGLYWVTVIYNNTLITKTIVVF